MKRIISGLLVVLLALSVISFAAACSAEKAEDDVLDTGLGMAQEAIKEYEDEVNSATKDDVAKLREDGKNLQSTLDDEEKAIDDADDTSEEDKQSVKDEVESLRKQLQESIDKLDTIEAGQ